MVLEKSVNRSPRHQKFYSDSQKVHKGLIIERENSDVRRVCFLACISWRFIESEISGKTVLCKFQ